MARGTPLTSEEKKDLVVATWRAYAGYDNETAFRHIHEDVVWELPGVPGFPARGRGKLLEMSEYGRKAYLDQRTVELKNVFCDGNTVILEYKSRARRANGKLYVNDYLAIFDLADDQIVGIREYFDTKAAAESASA